MKIQEIEKELNITRANIRFYEKEGLLTPPRKENGYRDYGDEEIAQLKKIIIFRKLGISVADIKSIFDGSLSLQTAVDNNIDRLHKEIEELNGAIEVCEQIREDNSEEKDFPQDHFWNVINNRENKGEKFNEIIKDYIREEFYGFTHIIEMFCFVNLRKVKEKFGILGTIIVFLLISAGFALFRCLLIDDLSLSTFFVGFAYPTMIFLCSSILFFPLHLLMRFLKKKHPKIAKILDIILLIGAIIGLIKYDSILLEILLTPFKLFKFLFETFYL